MAWFVTLVLVHLVAFFGACALYWRAPCWMQTLAVFGLAIAMGIIGIGYTAMLGEAAGLGWWGGWYVITLGLVIEHIAVLLYIFRLVYREHVQWQNSSARSPNLLA